MSTSVFPTLAGLGWSVTRREIWKTRQQEAISGKETRIADWSYPRHQWSLGFDFLRQGALSGQSYSEFALLAGFFDLRQGAFDSFLYVDADDNAVTGQAIATGDGATTSFAFVRGFGGFAEPVLAPNVVSHVYLNGVAQSPSSYGPLIPTLERAARFLERGQLGTAQEAIAKLPLPPLTAFGEQLTRIAPGNFDPDKHPRWPAGSPDSTGGEFRPVDDEDASDDSSPEPSQTLAGNLNQCIESCYHLLDRWQPPGQFHKNEWDFQRCLAACQGKFG